MERLRELLRFDGRLSRLGFWRGYLLLGVLGAIALVVGLLAIMGFGSWGAVFLAPLLPLVIASIAIIVRRLHDRGKSALWLLPFVIGPFLVGLWLNTEGKGQAGGPMLLVALTSLILNIWGLVEIGFLGGTRGVNRFGEAPAAGR